MTIDSAVFGEPTINPDGSYVRQATIIAKDGNGELSHPFAAAFAFAAPPPVMGGSVTMPKNLKLWPSSKGDIVLTTPGDIVDGYDVHARIVRKADNTGATNSIVRGLDNGAPYATSLIDLYSEYTGFTARNILGVPTAPSNMWQGVIGGHDYVAEDIEGHDLVDGFAWMNTHGADLNADILRAYIHDHFYGKEPSQPDGYVHGDGGQWQGGIGLKVRNSLFTGLNNPKYKGPVGSNSALMLSPNVNAIEGLDVQFCILGGGRFATVNINRKTQTATLGILSNNVFLPTVNGNKTKGYGYQIGMHPGTNITMTNNLMQDGTPIKTYVGK